MQWVRDAHEILISEHVISDNAKERIFEVRLRTKQVSAEASPIAHYSVEYLILNAGVLKNSGDYILARTLYSYVLSQKDAHSSDALLGVGQCQFLLGDVASAYTYFQQALELAPSVQAYLWLAKCHSANGKDLLAIETLGRIDGLNSEPVELVFEYHKLLGNCLLRAGRLSEADEELRLAVELMPLNDGIRVSLGMLELERSNSTAALKAFEGALELNPKNIKAIAGLGLVSVANQDYSRAAVQFERALDLEPKNVTALIQLICLPGANFDRVALRAERFFELDPEKNDVRYYFAMWCFAHSRWAACEKHLTYIIKKTPTHTRAQALFSDLKKKFHKKGDLL